MKKVLLLLLLCSLSIVGYSQSYCTPSFGSAYYACAYYGNSITSFYLTGAAGSSISDGSGCSGSGYTDNSGSMSATLYLGGTYSVTVGYGGGTNEVQAWIDFDNDGTFASTETIMGYNYMYYSSYVYSFSIPGGVSTGTRRMRILVTASYYGPTYPYLDGCGGYYYGDSRDYSVDIATPPPSVTATPSSRNFGYVASGSTSASTAIAVVGSYLSSGSSPITVTAPSNFEICSTVGGTYVSSYTISYTGTSFSSTNVFTRFVAPGSTGTYTGNLSFTGGGLSSTYNVPLTGISASACSGSITAGTATITPSSGGISPLSISISLTGGTAASGLTYQWQSATTAGGTYSNISGATDFTYSTTGLTSSRYYRCNVSCTASGSSSTSSVAAAPVYCSASFYYGGSTVSYFGSVSIPGSTGSISDGSTASSAYLDRTSLSCTMAAGATYTATVAPISSGYSQTSSVWIDFNDDGTFSTSEIVGGRNGFSSSTTYGLTIPTTSATGTHRMRALIMYNAYGSTHPSTSPCPTGGYPYYYGQVRDYLVTIAPPPPSIVATPTTIAFGGVTSGDSSSASAIAVVGSYLLGATGNLTVTAPTMFEVSTTGTSLWATSVSVSYSGAAYTGTVYVRFKPTSTGSRSGNVSISGGSASSPALVAVTGFGSSGSCSGTPSPGTASASPTSANPLTSVTLSLPSLTPTGGYTYQWRSSASGTAGTFTNISGATNVAYTFSGLTATTYYNCVVTCTGSGGVDSSGNATVTFTLPSTSCTPSASAGSFGCTVGGMASVSITGGVGSISDGACSSGGYQDRTSSSSITLYRSLSYVVTIAPVSASYSKSTQVWIDFNSNGTFESSETVGGTTSTWTSSATPTITIPGGSAVGTFRMRVLTVYTSEGTYSGIDPCRAGSYLDGRDYTVVITNSPPTLTRTPSSLNFGSVTGSTTSSALSTAIVGSFLTPASGTLTVTAPTNYQVCSTVGGTYVNSYTISYSSSALASTSVFVKFVAPATAGTYTGTVTITGGGLSGTNVPVTGISATPCSGTPTAGTAAITPTSGTTTTSFALSLTGFTTDAGITFQWQSATTSGGTYTNISGATNTTYSAGTLSASRYYRCVVTCTVSGSSATSNVVGALVYCTPTFLYTGTVSAMNSFSLTGSTGSITDATTSSSLYIDRTSLSCTMAAGSSYNATVTPSSTNGQSFTAWIDFNDDGTFTSTEIVGGNGAFTTTTSIALAIPTTSTTGSHRMRALIMYNGYGTAHPSASPCPTTAYPYYYGQVRDYLVTIDPPPPALAATPTTIAFGGVVVGDSSSVSSTAVTGSYLTPTSGNLTITAPNYFKVSANGTTWFTSYTQSYTGAVISSVPVYVRFFPPSSGSFTGSVTITGGGFASTVNVVVTGTGASLCSGTPTGGTTAGTPTSGSSATAFSLSLTGATTDAGLTYQWQSSPTGAGGSFTNISGATSSIYAFTGISSTTTYRCLVTCSVSGSTDSSSNRTLTFVLPTASCTPTWAYTGYCSGGGMSSVNLTGVSSSISDASACTSGYQNRTSLSCTLYKANTYVITLGGSGSASKPTQWWIDFNSDGTFQSTETVGGGSFTSTGLISISIPATVPSGVFRMRGISNYYYNAYPSMNPCGGTTTTNYYYGDGRDYTVTITNPPPSGSVTPTSLDFSNVTPTATADRSTAVTGLFLLPTSGNLTVSSSSSDFGISSTSGSGYATSYLIAYTGGTVTSVPVYARFTAPSTTGTYTGTITISGGGLSSSITVPMTGNSANACSGTPSAGTASITPSTGGTTTTSFSLNLTGYAIATGLTFQWQSATTAGGTYSNISGATNTSYTIGTLSATRFYRCVVTCTASGSSANSNVVGASIYCTPSFYYTTSTVSNFSAFRITGSTGSIVDLTSSSSNYLDRTSLSCTLTAGVTYTTTVTPSSTNGQSTTLWIDFNDDGTYASSEIVGGNASFTATATYAAAIPLTATTGNHRMRSLILYNGYGTSHPSASPCPTASYPYYYGQVRDYIVTIAPPPPVLTGTPSTIAFGGVLTTTTSASQTFVMTGSYLVGTTGNVTVTAPTNFEVSTTGTSGWTNTLTLGYTGGAITDTLFVRFTPPAASSYSGSISITGGSASTAFVVVSGTGATNCSGTPTAGTANATPTSGTTSTAFTLSLSGTSAVASLTYQWQSSATGTAGSFTSISGATNPTYGFTGITADVYYRCLVTCSVSGVTDSSSNRMLTYVLPSASCTPTVQYSGYCYIGGMSAVRVIGVSTTMTDATACSGGGYLDRTSAVTPTTLFQANTYTVSITSAASGYNQNRNCWIDFNNDGTFQTTELVGSGSSSAASSTFSITIPSTVPSGTFRMRLFNNYYYAPTNPCGGSSYPYYYGDIRDYRVVITNPPPTAAASPTSLSFGTIATSSTSSALSTNVTGLFLLPSSGTLTVTAPTNFTVASTVGGTYGSSYTISYSGGTLSSTAVFVKFVAPSTVATYSGSVTVTGGGLASALNIPVTGNAAVACTGTPTPGTASASPAGVTSGGTFTLSLSGTTVALGIGYQWQSATSFGGTYSNISGATNATYSTSLTSIRYYQCVVTCSFAGSPATSNIVTVPIYCTPSWYYGSSTVSNFSAFRINGSTGSIADVTSSTSGYLDRTSLSCTLTAGVTYTTTVTPASTNTQSTTLWIDFNDDGTYASSEIVGGTNGFTSTTTYAAAIPLTATPGNHRARALIMYNAYGSVHPSSSPCPTAAYPYYYGQVRDYLFTIIPPPPVVTAIPSTISFGGSTVGSATAAQTFTMTGSYLLPTSGSLTLSAPSNYEISSTGTSGWASSYTVTYTGGTLGSTLVYVRFTPPSTGTYTGSVSITGGGLSTATNVTVSGVGALACSGTPTAGTGVATPSSGTSATVFTLSLSGTSSFSGYTYQWFTSSTSTGGYTAISGATNATYGFSGLLSDTYYKCAVTCPGFGSTDTSSQVLVTYVLPTASCNVSVQYPTSCTIGGLSAVRLNGVLGTSFADVASCAGSGYQDRTSLGATLYKSSSYVMSVTPSSSGYSTLCNVWIDFSGNGTFETSELVNTTTTSFTSSTTFSIAIPSGVPSGTFRMRVFANYYYNPTNPCGGTSYPYYYGEGRDYKVLIMNPPPVATASPTSLNFGTISASSTSSSLSFNLAGLFLLPTSGNLTITAPTNYQVCSTVGGTYVSSYTVSYTSGTYSSTAVFARFVAPATTGTYAASVTITGGGLASTLNVPVTGNSATPCTGTPATGTIGITPTSGTSGTTFVVSLAGTSVGLGITYQWMSSTSGTSGSFTNITGATNTTYSVSGLTGTVFYQCEVSCGYSGATSTSGVIQATVFCQPSFLGCLYSYLGGMTGFYVNGFSGSIADAASCSTTGYRDQTSLSCTLRASNSYVSTIATSASNAQSAQVWIDFDDDGTFGSTETVGGSAAFTYNGFITISIPAASATGNHRMRVMEFYNGYGSTYNYPTANPCYVTGSIPYYGEARDYTVNIAPPPATIVASPSTVAFGGVLTSTTAPAQTFSVTGTYLTPSSGNLTVTAPSNFRVSPDGSTWYTTSYSISYTGATLSATTVYVDFTPPAATSYTGSVAITGGGASSATNVVVTGSGAGACSGTPTAGTASISPTSGNASTSFTLSLAGTTVASGLTYQWQSSTSGAGGSFSNISGATNASYGFTGITSTMYYQCIVSCGGSSATSSTTNATFVIPSACTPSWYYTSYCYVSGFNAVTLAGASGTISDATACTGSGYLDRTSLSATLYKTGTYTISITPSTTSYSQGTQWWLDYNGNATFESSETIGGVSSYTSATSFSFTVPSTVASGTYRLRGMAIYSAYGTYPSLSACPTGAYPYYYGEVRDYTINITNPPPAVVATPSTLSFGAVLPTFTSSALTTSITGTYMLPTTGTVTVTAPTNFQVSSDGSTWVTSYTVSYSAATISATTVYVNFTPPSSGSYTGSVTITGGGLASAANIVVTGNGASACAATPSAGSATTTSATASTGTTFTVGLSGTSVVAGLTYQWQSSTDSISFSNISGATGTSYTRTGISVTNWYRCVVTCPSYASATSSMIRVRYVVPSASCIPTWTYATPYGGFSRFTVNGGASTSIDDASSSTSGYVDRTSTYSVTMYGSYSYVATIVPVYTGYSTSAEIWIDFNSDGTFQTTESVGSRASFTATTTITMAIPGSVSAGTYRMRVLSNYYYVTPPLSPCATGGTYYYGDARDYTVNIAPPPPVLTTSPSTLAFGGVLSGDTSSAQMFTMSGLYMLPTTGTITVTAPGNYLVSDNGTTWGTSFTASYSGAVVTDTAYVRFRPTASTSYPANVSITGGGLSSAVNVAVNGTGAGVCTSTPSAGTASSSPTSGSTATTFTLTLSGTTLASGLTYQWRRSDVSASGPYTNISGATNASYSVSGLTANAFFKCFVGCPTYGTDSTAAVTITWTLPSATCTPTFTYTSLFGSLQRFTLNGISSTQINDAASATGSYQNRTSLGCTLYMASSYTSTVIPTYTGYTTYAAAWIDFNNDGTFQTTESVGTTSAFSATTTMSITIPGSVSAGVFRMRVLSNYYYNPPLVPCPSGGGSYNYGDARDYTVTIAPLPPSIVATPATLSFGGVLATTTSASQSTIVTGSYLSPSSGNITITAPTNYQVSTDGTTWATSYVAGYTGSAFLDTTYVRFTPPSTGTFTGSITITGGGIASTVNVVVSGTGAGACSGTPFAGTASISPTSGTGSTTFTATLAGTTIASGLQFQWQSALVSAGPWTAISGATNNSYTFSGITDTMFYRAVVVCSGSAGDTSSIATALFVLPTPCTPAYLYGGCSSPTIGGMTGFQLYGSAGSILDGAGCSSSGYRNQTSLSCGLVTGNTFVATINTSTTTAQSAQVWIDFNDNGTFASGETVGGNVSFTGNGTVSITIPGGATAGVHRMRVVAHYAAYGASYNYPNHNPCITTANPPYYGEVRDYLVNIVAPTACSGTPAPGAATATVTAGCAGLSTGLDITGLVGVSGITYQWQASSTGGAGTFTSISGATARNYVATASATTYYNVVATCTTSGGSGTSSSVAVTTTPAPTSITGSTTGCVSASTTLSNGTSGGTWTSSAPSVASVNPTSGVVTGVSVGTTTISYTTSGCAPATLSFSVNGTPGTTSGFTSTCVGGTALLSNTVSGGTWSSANTAIASVNPATGRVFALSAGTTTISYSTGCGTPATTSWTTNPTPTNITGPSSICVSSTGTFSDSVSGGTWTNSPTTVGTIDASTGVFYASATTGTSIITYTIGFCSITEIATVGSRTPAAIAGASSVCAGATTTLTNDTTGGAWSTSDAAIASISTAGVVRGITSGTATITYSTGCGTDATRSMTVNGSPVGISSSTACSQGTLGINAVVGTGSYTYSWTGPLGFTSTSGTPTITNVPTRASGIYSVVATQSGCSASTSAWVSVDSTPQVSLTATPSSICPGGSSNLALTVNSPAAGTNNYAVHAIPYAPVSVSTVTAGPTGDNVNSTVSLPFTFTLYGTAYTSVFISTNGYINFGTSSTSTTVVTLPSSSAPRSMISPFFHNMNATTGTINYSTTGTSPNRRFIVNFNNVADQAGGGTNAGQIVLYETSSMIEMFITRANTNSNYNLVCGIQNAAGSIAATVPGQNNVNYAINNTVAGSGWRFMPPSYSYAWSPATALSSTSISNPVSSGLTSSQTYSVTTIDAYSGCTAGNTSNTTVNVYTLPAVRTISPATGCSAGTTITLDSTEVGVNYQLFVGGSTAVGSPVAGTGTSISFGSITTAGTYTIVGTLATGGCTSNMNGTTVISTSPTAYTLTGGSGCTASGVTIGVSNSQSGVSYALMLGSTTVATVGGTGASISFGSQTAAGTYTVIATGAGSCATTMTGSSVISTSPTAYSVTGGSGCTSTGVTVGLGGSETGVSYQLYNGASTVGSAVAGTGSAISFGLQSAAGTYTVVATGAGSCQTNMTGSATIATSPSVTVGAMPSICSPDSTATLSYSTGAGSPTTYSIAWGSTALTAGFSDVASATLPGSAISIATPSSVTGAFNGTLTVSNASCTSTAYSLTVTRYAHPDGAITSATAPCMGYATNVVFTGTSGATVSYRVDGGSLSTATLTGGTFSLGTGALTDTTTYTIYEVYNPACGTIIDSTITVIPTPMQWVGGVSGSETDWSATGNWSCGFVPTVTDDVLIPAGTTYAPIITASGTGTTRALSLASGASVTLNTGSVLSVKGGLHNNGMVTGAGSLEFNGGAAHSISGMGSVSNLNVNDGTAGASVASGSLLTITNTLTLSAGSFATGDSVVLASDSSVTARLTPVAVGASMTGNVRVMQYIPGGYRRYRFFGHPFSTATTLSQIQNYIDVTGMGGSANGFTSTASNMPSVFRYNTLVGNSAMSYDPGWRPVTSALVTAHDTNKIHQYQCVRVFMRGAKGEGLGYTPYTPSSVVIGQWGPLNVGDQNVTMIKGSGANQDYNMLSNPYASPVDIATVIYNASVAGRIVGSSFYIWDPYMGAGGQFRTIAYSSTGAAAPYYLQANAGFQVRTVNNGDQLNFTESNKGSSATDPLLKVNPGYISLTVLDESNHPWDVVNVKFDDFGTDNEDMRHDAAKLSGGELNFYSLSADAHKLAMDVRPYKAQSVIPLGINSNYSQSFTIQADNVVVPDGGKVYLHDILLGKYVLLQSGTSYSFNITKDAATQGEKRFELSVEPAGVSSANGFAVSMTPNPATDEVKISFATDASEKVAVRVMDMSGVSVYHEEIGNRQSGIINIPLSSFAAGVYMVELTSGDHKFVQRLIKE